MKNNQKNKIIGSVLIFLGLLVLGLVFARFFGSSFGRKILGADIDPRSSQLHQNVKEAFAQSYQEDPMLPKGKLKEFSLTAAENEVEIIKGYKTKVWSYNEQVPGPELRITKGDTLRIVLKNSLPDETTIHWHGIRLPNEMDGVPGVTQDPIQPGETFVYEFTPKDTGTYWFHPHVRGAEQLERGLYGSVIIEDPEEKELFNSDTVWVLDDWRLDQNAQVDPNFLLPHDVTHDGRWGNVISINGEAQYSQAFNPGERVRLRIINASNARVYNLNFESLDVNIIAVDGNKSAEFSKPQKFDLAPGNRIDVEINMPEKEAVFNVTDTFTGRKNTIAEIKTTGENIQAPQKRIKENENIKKINNAIDLPVDYEYEFDGGMGMMRRGGLQWTINGEAYPDVTTITYEKNGLYRISLKNNSANIHPMHLHGQFFKVISKNNKDFQEPFLRDTVLVEPNQTVDILLMPKDMGTWALHCHIQEHAEAGMMTLIKVE